MLELSKPAPHPSTQHAGLGDGGFPAPGGGGAEAGANELLLMTQLSKPAPRRQPPTQPILTYPNPAGSNTQVPILRTSDLIGFGLSALFQRAFRDVASSLAIL